MNSCLGNDFHWQTTIIIGKYLQTRIHGPIPMSGIAWTRLSIENWIVLRIGTVDAGSSLLPSHTRPWWADLWHEFVQFIFEIVQLKKLIVKKVCWWGPIHKENVQSYIFPNLYFTVPVTFETTNWIDVFSVLGQLTTLATQTLHALKTMDELKEL